MKYVLSVLASLFITVSSFGQLTITSTGNCISDTLVAHFSGAIPTDIGLYSDDDYSGVITGGFPFKFYGTTYTQFVVGENGMVTFNTSLAGGYDPWPISAALLGNSSAYNSICGPWCDIDGLTGTQPIYYSLQGVAPNRSMAITWCGVDMFSCSTQYITTQIIMYETSNIVEVHTTHKDICSWNGGYAIIGVQNASGSAATTAPGRDYPSVYTLTNEAWRFTPNIAGTAYAVASIPFAPIVYRATSVYWYNAATSAYLGSGDTIIVTPTTTTTYKAGVVTCQDTVYGSVVVNPGITINPITFGSPTACNIDNGFIRFHGFHPGDNVSVRYTLNGVAVGPVTFVADADSNITFSNLPGGVYSNFYITRGGCIYGPYGPYNLVYPAPVPASFYLTEKLGCSGDQVNVYNTSTPAGYNGYWNWGDGTSDSSGAFPETHLYKDSVLGYVATYTVTLTYEPYHNIHCLSTHDTVVSFDHPISAAFTEDNTAVCVGVPVNFTNSSIANGPSYSWDFGDGFTDTTKNPSHAYATGGDYNVVLVTKDTIGCYSLPASNEVTAVQVDIHASVADTSVCLTDSMHLHATTVVLPPSEVSYYIYWSPSTNLGEDSTTTPNFFGIGTFAYTVNLVTTAPAVCMASDNETVHSYPPVTLTGLTASPTVIPYGGTVMLNADGAVYYSWSPDNGTLSNVSINDPVATPTDTTTIYTVYGTNLYGCLDSAKITVNLDIDHLEDLPTGFTPDGDGLNDVFRITHLKYKKLVEFRVYNRWGQEVFSTTNPEVGWDGTFHGVPQDIGVYNYQIIAAESDGTQKVYKGSVTLIR